MYKCFKSVKFAKSLEITIKSFTKCMLLFPALKWRNFTVKSGFFDIGCHGLLWGARDPNPPDLGGS